MLVTCFLASFGVLATVASPSPAVAGPPGSAAKQSTSIRAQQPAGPAIPASNQDPVNPRYLTLVVPGTPQAEPETQTQSPRRARPREKVVCGMTIIEVDPSLDPKMVLELKGKTHFTMRRYPPPACGQR